MIKGLHNLINDMKHGDMAVELERAGAVRMNERQATFCAVFTNPSRIQIMLELGGGELSVGELAERLGISMPGLSQHLKLMKQQHCLLSRREGRRIYYRVSSPLFLQAMKLVRAGIRDADRLASGYAEE